MKAMLSILSIMFSMSTYAYDVTCIKDTTKPRCAHTRHSNYHGYEDSHNRVTCEVTLVGLDANGKIVTDNIAEMERYYPQGNMSEYYLSLKTEKNLKAKMYRTVLELKEQLSVCADK